MRTIWTDYCESIRCNQCKYHSNCKLLKGKNVEPYKPWFASVAVGQVCKYFEPANYCKWIKARWTTFQACALLPKEGTLFTIFVNGDHNTAYHVDALRYINDDFVDEDGNLIWEDAFHYVPSRKAPNGYRKVAWKNNGTYDKINVKKPIDK